MRLATSDDTWHVSNDNYRFFNYELFLSFVAFMLKYERFDIVHDVVSADFCILSHRMGRQSLPMSFIEFQKYNYTLDHYKNGIEQSSNISEAALLMSNVMFEVSTKEEFVSLVQGLTDKIEYNYYHRIPNIKEGLCVDKACTWR